ncbi:MAG: hypothetical protein U9Q77_07895 [Candidatus Marinimicrobia bacterium]|nr:hypothetical protein [Candidatus Neomarinimicrobiota bacterium]
MNKSTKLYLLFILSLLLNQCSIFAPDEEVTRNILVAYDIRNSGSGRSDYDIWLTDFDGEGERVLVSETSNEYQPRFNKDGSGIFYISTAGGDRDLFYLDTAGTASIQLTTDRWISSYDVSPRGDKLVFVDDVGGRSQVYEINIDGQNLNLLTRGYDPVYTDHGDAVILLNSEGSRNIRKVTIGSADTLEITTAAPSSWIIAIAAERERFIVWSRPDHLSSYSYYFMSQDGDFINSLTFSTGFNGRPILSGDGMQIGYSAYSSATKGVEIFVGNVALSTPLQLTKQGLVAHSPQFFPGDDFLIYTLENGDDYFLYHIDSKGRNKVRITSALRYAPIQYDVFVY